MRATLKGVQTMEIERGIPIPAGGGSEKKGYSELLCRLKVGESVVLPTDNNTVSALARQIRRRKANPCRSKFTSRKIDGEHTRVWRIE